MKKYIFILFLFLPFILKGVIIDDAFVEFENFKKMPKFYYPILTINGEFGERFAYNPFEDLTEEDFEVIDSYKFYVGYLKLLQHITKESKLNLFYMYKEKDYKVNTNFCNKNNTFNFSFVYQILPILTADLGVKYKISDFIFEEEKDSKQISPEMEIRLNPKKSMILGFKYVYINMKYKDEQRDSKGNRFLIYFQDRFFDRKVYFRIRYRGENRDYLYPTLQRKSSFKYSVSATAIIDFN